ncbi:MAG: hypothetical protein ACE5IM_00940 [Nitrospinota bacterium]
MAPDPERAASRLVEVLWREQGKFRPRRIRRFLSPRTRLAVGAVVDAETNRRTLFSARLERLLARHLERVSGLPVFPRREMARWEEDILGRKAKSALSLPSFRPETSVEAAEFAAADALVVGSYRMGRKGVVVSGEFIRFTPALDTRTLSVARARISLRLDAVPISEHIARMPARRRNLLPIPPDDWQWNPISIWYEVIQPGGKRSKGVDGAVLTPADTFLVSFMAARPLYVMVLRLDNEGNVRVLFPAKAGDLSERVEIDRRYAVPDRLAESSRWATAYVLFSDEPFRYRRDVLPGLRKIRGLLRAGVSAGMARAGIVLPKGIYQKPLWFTLRRG